MKRPFKSSDFAYRGMKILLLNSLPGVPSGLRKDNYFQMKMQIAAIAICLSILCSCGFNKQFYQADKLQPNSISALFNNLRHDTTFVHVTGANFQPVFTDSKNNPKDMGFTIQSLVFKSESGNKLNGWFFKPDKSIAENGTTMLFLHGNGGNVFEQMQGPIDFIKQGFQVFLIDYSGYGFSTGKSTREHFLQDGNSALKYMLTMPGVKNTKVIIYGQSLGGHLSATVAAQNEKAIDGLVMEGAPSSHKDIAAYSFRKVGFLARILTKEKYPAYKAIEHFHKPVLIIHSSEDKVVPEWMVKKIYAHANEPKYFYEIKYGHIQGPEHYADSISFKIKMMLHK